MTVCYTKKERESHGSGHLVPQYFSKGCNGYIQGTFSSFWKLCTPFIEMIFTIAWSSVLIISLQTYVLQISLSRTMLPTEELGSHQRLSIVPHTINAQGDEQPPMSLMFSKEHVTKQTPSTWLDWEGKSTSGGLVCTYAISCLFGLDTAFLLLLTGWLRYSAVFPEAYQSQPTQGIAV